MKDTKIIKYGNKKSKTKPKLIKTYQDLTVKVKVWRDKDFGGGYYYYRTIHIF